jgi:ABC-type transport system substrate-binding protein
MAGPKYAPDFAEYWKPPSDFYGQPVYGGTLRINTHDTLSNGNIWGASESARNRIPTTNQLLQLNPYDTDGPLIPDLAYGWTVHDDAQGVTFYFPENIKWHNGADFTCEDARFSYNTMTTGEGLTVSIFTELFTHFDPDYPQCLDDFTLEFRFQAPSATPLDAMSDRYAVMFNKEWFLAGGEDAMFLDLSVGTGPFMWKEGQLLGEADAQHFEKNPDYFLEGLPYVDELILFSIVDESSQQAAMLSHQTNWHWVRNFGQYNAYVDHDQIMTVIRATNGAVEFVMNKRNPPFDNLRVRQAIAMGIDREAGIKILQQGHGSLGFLFPPGSAWELDRERGCAVPGWCQPDDMEAQRAEARQILQEEGFDFNKTYVMTVDNDRQKVDFATFLQEQLRLLGIQTDFDTVESVAFAQMGVDGTWGDFRAHDGIDSSETGLAMGRNFRCDAIDNYWNPGTECDPKMEGLLDQLDAALDPAERKRVSDEVQLYAMGEYWKVNMFWEQEAVAFWPEVRGYAHFVRSVGSYNKFSHMWVDPAHKDDTGFRGQTTGVPGGL